MDVVDIHVVSCIVGDVCRMHVGNVYVGCICIAHHYYGGTCIICIMWWTCMGEEVAYYVGHACHMHVLKMHVDTIHVGGRA